MLIQLPIWGGGGGGVGIFSGGVGFFSGGVGADIWGGSTPPNPPVNPPMGSTKIRQNLVYCLAYFITSYIKLDKFINRLITVIGWSRN